MPEINGKTPIKADEKNMTNPADLSQDPSDIHRLNEPVPMLTQAHLQVLEKVQRITQEFEEM
jgi:hypothetical protein